jgi:hypothetical protein
MRDFLLMTASCAKVFLFRAFTLAAVTVLSPLSGCSNDFFTEPAPFQGLLSLRTMAGDTVAKVSADGYSRVTLVAKIDRGTLEAHRTIVFTTTHGTLFTGATKAEQSAGKLAEVIADANGEARIDVLSEGTPADGRLTATVKDVPSATATIPLSLVAVNADSVIKFETPSFTIGGDGFSTQFVSARIAGSIPIASRTVHFETTAGSFIGATAAAGGGVDVLTDASNTATVLYQSAAQSGPVIIRAKVASVTRELTVTLVPVKGDSILRLSVPQLAIDADGASVVTASVWVAPRVPAASRNVKLSITSGTFISNPATTADGTLTLAVGQDDSVHVDIKAPLVDGLARLRVTVGNFTQDALITFRVAAPDTILLSADHFKLTPTETASVTARLIRHSGTASKNTFLVFTANDSTGATVGAFRDQMPSNDTGVAAAVFGAPEVTSSKTVYLHAALMDGTRLSTYKLIVGP